MAVEAAASVPRGIAANLTSEVDGTAEAGAQALPPSFTDAQGRVFTLQQDPATGAPQYHHSSQQRDASGSTLDLDILVTLAADGGFTRRTTQDLKLSTGDTQHEVTTATYGADGKQVAELTEGSSREGSATSTERTVGTFADGQLVRRETDIDQADEATNEKTGEITRIEAKIHGTWDEGGAPITAQTVPHVDRTEHQKYTMPGEGLHTNQPRTIDFSRHAAGPVGALEWDPTGTMIVRFEGNGGQYIEREIRMPLDRTTGAPDMTKSETIRTDDHQNFLNKAMLQTRIWGGLASNLAWIGGLRFASGGMRTALLGFSAAASAAQLVGETHAVATKRADGDWSRVVSAAYDTLLTGLLGAYIGGRGLSSGQTLGLTALGGVGVAANGAELLGRAPVGADALETPDLDVTAGSKLLGSSDRSAASDWRAEPRFDAAAALAA